jgi:hypothetical protein
MNHHQAVRALGGLRLAVGLGAWLTPRVAGRAFGLDPAANPQSPYLARLFGVRDVALAVGTTQAAGPARRQWLQLGVACDVADAAAALLAGRAGYLPKVSAALVFAPAVAAAAMGVAAIADEPPTV